MQVEDRAEVQYCANVADAAVRARQRPAQAATEVVDRRHQPVAGLPVAVLAHAVVPRLPVGLRLAH